MRARNGVRIFNMSLNIIQQAAFDRYSLHAARLDRIAEENDAIIFVSAGNLDPRDLRPEWSEDTTKALADVAASINDGLLSPAESVRNVSVTAVNPPGHPISVPFSPCRFSRRGPGLRTGVKLTSLTSAVPVLRSLLLTMPSSPLTLRAMSSVIAAQVMRPLSLQKRLPPWTTPLRETSQGRR